jgi:hypothetical protein
MKILFLLGYQKVEHKDPTIQKIFKFVYSNKPEDIMRLS